jgi:8-oxo-dGTP pyrophosphatase MutT (NUDIX family)
VTGDWDSRDNAAVPSRADLIGLLTAYDPSDADEVGYRLRMLDLAAVAYDPFSRHEYAPGHFTASGFVLHPVGDRILLVHHGRLGIWVQPGGHVDPGDDTLLGAAMREIEEETGLADLHPVARGLFDIDIHVFPENADQPRHLHFDLRFGFVGGHDRVSARDGTVDARWVSRSDLPALGVDRSVIRPAVRALGMGDEGSSL